jgi:orotate phosphoribosyltransferase
MFNFFLYASDNLSSFVTVGGDMTAPKPRMTRVVLTGIQKNFLRQQALAKLDEQGVRLTGHYDYGDGFHGTEYLNPHALLRYPSTVMLLTQYLVEVLPAGLLDRVEVVAGPEKGGAKIAFVIAGIIDGSRPIGSPPIVYVPIDKSSDDEFSIKRFYQNQLTVEEEVYDEELPVNGPTNLSPIRVPKEVKKRPARILLVDDIKNKGQTFRRCRALIEQLGGDVLATAELFDRQNDTEIEVVPNHSLARSPSKEKPVPIDRCPDCRLGIGLSSF